MEEILNALVDILNARPASRIRIIDRLRRCCLLAFSSYRVLRGRFPSWLSSSLNLLIQAGIENREISHRIIGINFSLFYFIAWDFLLPLGFLDLI